MALKALMLKKNLDGKRSALADVEKRQASFEQREAEIAAAIEEVKTDEERAAVEASIAEFEADKEAATKDAETLRAEIEAMEAELAALEAEAPAPATDVEPTPEQRGKDMAEIITRDSRQYVDAFANYIKTGKVEEVRTLLTENASGTVAVPTFVEQIIKTAWDNEPIMSRVSKTNMQGNVKIGFEISATGAEIHTEGGEAIDEETLTLGIAALVPATIKKWIRISTEVYEMGGEAFLRYIYAELSHQIIKKLADQLVGIIAALPTTATSSSVAADKVSAAPAMATVASAIAHLSDEAANPVIIMNKLTYAEFKTVQYANGYGADPFEGLPVLFNNTLPAYSAASTGNVYMIVGDLGHGARANYPGGEEIKFVFDEFTEAEADLVKIVGRQYVAVNAVAMKAFANITKPASA